VGKDQVDSEARTSQARCLVCPANREQIRRLLGHFILIDFPLEEDADLDHIMSTAEHNLLKSIMVYDQHVLHVTL